MVLSWALCVLSLRIGGTKRHSPFGAYHSSTIITKESVNKLGLMPTMRLEITELLFPGDNDEDFKLVVTRLPRVDTGTGFNGGDRQDKNVDDKVDFERLDTYSYDESVQDLNKYLSFMRPTSKNAYTGKYKGKNLIAFCAESYAPVLVSEELTPTLYKLTHEGFVFTNYYTSFANTTTNCEYAFCTGLFPDLTRAKFDASFIQSAKDYLPYCYGNAFSALGYKTFFFHNNVGSFYQRNLSHPNMGYKCVFEKEVLQDEDGNEVLADEDYMEFSTDQDPTSDLEMIQQSMPYYLERDHPFVAYYMTYSGHYPYDYKNNPMCAKNRERVEQYVAEYGLDYSEDVQAYLACNLELEDALTELIRALDEKGILEDTVIVLTGDHYPYGLIDYQYAELYGEELDDPFDQMKNSFICWPGDMAGKEPVVCDNYCCNIDILPTVLNLFGIRYDSRLLAGTDVLSDGDHIAFLTDESFLTDVMMFDSTNNEITYFVDETIVPKNYFDDAVPLIQNKMNMSTQTLYTDYYKLVYDAKHYTNPEEKNKSFTIALGWYVLLGATVLYIVIKVVKRLHHKKQEELAAAAAGEAASAAAAEADKEEAPVG